MATESDLTHFLPYDTYVYIFISINMSISENTLRKLSSFVPIQIYDILLDNKPTKYADFIRQPLCWNRNRKRAVPGCNQKKNPKVELHSGYFLTAVNTFSKNEL